MLEQQRAVAAANTATSFMPNTAIATPWLLPAVWPHWYTQAEFEVVWREVVVRRAGTLRRVATMRSAEAHCLLMSYYMQAEHEMMRRREADMCNESCGEE